MKEKEHRYQGKVSVWRYWLFKFEFSFVLVIACRLTFNYSLVLSALAPDGFMSTPVYGCKKKNNLSWKTQNMSEETRSVIQHVLGNWIADINQPPSIFCSPMCRRDVPYWMLEERKSLELDVKFTPWHSLRAMSVLLALPSCLFWDWELHHFFDAFQTPSGYSRRLLGLPDEVFF